MPYAPQPLPCDGCGQLADPQHIALRLQRLEWATRFRPVHIQALLLSGIAPASDDEFLYSPSGDFVGEARQILDAVQITTGGKSADLVLTEFQKRGLMLVHLLECPLQASLSPVDARSLFQNQLRSVVTRIRRSLKPKRILLLSAGLQPVADQLRQTDLGAAVYPATGTFFAHGAATEVELRAFREVLGASHVQTA